MLPTVQQKLERCPALPTIPAIAVKVLDLCQKERLNMAEISKVICNDPALATKVLRMANSPVMGLRSPAKTVAHALALLGVNAVRTLVLSFSLVQERSKGKDSSHKQYWKRSLLSALAAQELARAVRAPYAAEAFLAGLLQDIGILALTQALKDSYPSMVLKAGGDHSMLIELERIQLGCDHADVGRWLLTKWKVPNVLIEVVAGSHSSGAESDDPEITQLTKVVALSGWLADIWLAPDTASVTARAQVRAKVLMGLEQEALAPILQSIAEAMTGEVAKLLEVDVGTPDEVNAILEQAQETLLFASVRAEQEAEQARESNTLLEEQHRALREESQRDKLTKLYNRERFDEYLAEEFKRAVVGIKPLSILFCDVDYFKKVNDTLGHPAGDLVLIAVAKLLGERLRQKDLAVRYGGEEFVLILPETDAAGALTVGERIRKRIEETPVQTESGPINVTISIGTATVGSERRYGTPTELVTAADQALYAAKRSGRNRVVEAPRTDSAGRPIASGER